MRLVDAVRSWAGWYPADVARRQKSSKKGGGRRAAYAPAVDQVGVRKHLPIGWANWLGFVMFGLITIALFAEVIASVVESRGADPVAAAVMTVVFATMTYLFGTTRVKD
jgi:hypothetical protein